MLDSEERKILLENNKLLHKLVRAGRWATFFSILRWLVVLGVAAGTYYYLQPYLDQLLRVYGGFLSQFTL